MSSRWRLLSLLPSRQSSKVRGDIQGLRAIAVGSVVFDHLFHWPSGGFIGVDVFFVVSGFLITGVLLREFSKTGRISFTNFYRRRIRRILPAAILTLCVTVVASMFLLNAARAKSVALDAVSALFSVVNWRFAFVGADYFQAGGAVSPLQHFWSLAVEEQFYFVWPLLLFVVIVCVSRLARNQPGRFALTMRAVGVTLALIIVASFGWALFETANVPTIAYFSTLSRAWELAVGALIAVVAGRLTSIPPSIRTALAYIGLAGIASSLFVISTTSMFPAPWALLPVASTALVIVSGIGEEARFVPILSNRVTRYVGDISYSLYLWHFPIIILVAAVVPSPSKAHAALAIILMFVFAIASFHLVERPVNQSPLLERFANRDERRDAFALWWRPRSVNFRVGVALFLIAGILSSVGVVGVVRFKAAAAEASQPTEEVPTAFLATPGLSDTRADLASEMVDALNTRSWPALSPAPANIQVDGSPIEDASGCGHTVVTDPKSCAFGDPSLPSMVVFGDSTGITLLPTVRAAYGNKYFIRGLTMASCPVIDLDVVQDSVERSTDCSRHRADSLLEIERLAPDVVLVINNYEWAATERLKSRASGAAIGLEWAQAAASTSAKLAKLSKMVVFVTPPPEGKIVVDCATTVSVPNDCVSTIPETWRTGLAAEQTIESAIVHVFDTSEWFCGQSGRCPIFVGHTILRRDYVHTTRQWAEKVAPLFKEYIDPLLATTVGR